MPTKRKELSDLQRDLLQSAIRARQGKIWLPKGAADSFPTTYSALVSLQRRKLIEAERAHDPAVVSWKITKAGKEAVAPPKAAAAGAKSSTVGTAGSADRASIMPASGSGGDRTVPAAKGAVPTAAKSSRSMRDKSAAPPKGARGRGRT